MIQRILLKAIAKKNKQRLLRSIKQWMDLMRKMKNKKREEQIEALSLQIEQLKAENNRLRRDNERFVRLIDSGDWSRSRVEELRKVRSEYDEIANRFVFRQVMSCGRNVMRSWNSSKS